VNVAPPHSNRARRLSIAAERPVPLHYSYSTTPMHEAIGDWQSPTTILGVSCLRADRFQGLSRFDKRTHCVTEHLNSSVAVHRC
jgi:hypothetical protein